MCNFTMAVQLQIFIFPCDVHFSINPKIITERHLLKPLKANRKSFKKFFHICLMELFFFCRRRGGEESSEICPCGHRGVTPDLLPGLFCRVCCPHADDALLHAQRKEPPASSL